MAMIAVVLLGISRRLCPLGGQPAAVQPTIAMARQSEPRVSAAETTPTPIAAEHAPSSPEIFATAPDADTDKPLEITALIERQNQEILKGYAALSPEIEADLATLLVKLEDPETRAQMDFSGVHEFSNNTDGEALYDRIKDPEAREALRRVVRNILHESMKLNGADAETLADLAERKLEY